MEEIQEKSTLEIAFEKFNKVFDSYNEEFTDAQTEEERNDIDKKYTKLILEAEAALEEAVEIDFKEGLSAIAEEEISFNKVLIEQEGEHLKYLEEMDEDGDEGLSDERLQKLRKLYPNVDTILNLKLKQLSKLGFSLNLDMKENLELDQELVVIFFKNNIWIIDNDSK